VLASFILRSHRAPVRTSVFSCAQLPLPKHTHLFLFPVTKFCTHDVAIKNQIQTRGATRKGYVYSDMPAPFSPLARDGNWPFSLPGSAVAEEQIEKKKHPDLWPGAPLCASILGPTRRKRKRSGIVARSGTRPYWAENDDSARRSPVFDATSGEMTRVDPPNGKNTRNCLLVPTGLGSRFGSSNR